MANIIAVVDGDGERRQRFLQHVRAEIAPIDSLRIGKIESGDFAAVWAANDRAPISTSASPSAAAVIWGDAILGPGPKRLDAAGLLRAWAPRNEGPAPPPAFDGFYGALRYDALHGVTLGSDLLGLFPIYYAARAGTLLAGTSPELFRLHPLFPAKLSPEGLIGLLLAHAPLDGCALVSGVRRLGPGHVLRWDQKGGPLQVPQYVIPACPSGASHSFQADVDELDATLASAVDRHMPRGRNSGILLSGGRDSRLLAGYLRERGDELHAITLGSATDHEVSCATAVARTLGCVHSVVDVAEARLPDGATLQARWEHLGSGFSSIHMWGAIAPLRDLPPHFISGYLRDVRELEPPPVAFEALLGGSKHRGIRAATLRRLLRADLFAGLVDDLEQRMREVYEEGSTIEAQRPWRFLLAHDWRAHAGGVPWRLSFASWPVLPILDREVLRVLAALPDASLANRRAQDEILRRRFPDLARLPLDRNGHDTTPLLPSLAWRMRQRAERAVEPVRRRFRTRERRYYHRVYDINRPGWRAVRQLAEPHRERVAALFDMDVLQELLPAPDTRIAVEHAVRDSFGTKLLIGLMLWSASHLP